MLLSLRPRFATAVAEGRKTVELRRRFPEVAPGTRLVIYATLPVGAVVGMATISHVDHGTPDNIWERHGASVALTRSEFDVYLRGTDSARAVVLIQYTALPVPVPLDRMRELGVEPPQGFIYLDAKVMAGLTQCGSKQP